MTLYRIRYLGEWMFVSREAARLIRRLRREARRLELPQQAA